MLCCKTKPVFLNSSNGLINHSPRFPRLPPSPISNREAGKDLPRPDVPRPLVPRHVPANVAVAVLPLQNDAKSVVEKLEVGLAQNSNFRELHDLTARMLGYYREQDWTQALATIELCGKAAEPFGISALFDMYAECIEAFRRCPPPPD